MHMGRDRKRITHRVLNLPLPDRAGAAAVAQMALMAWEQGHLSLFVRAKKPSATCVEKHRSLPSAPMALVGADPVGFGVEVPCQAQAEVTCSRSWSWKAN